MAKNCCGRLVMDAWSPEKSAIDVNALATVNLCSAIKVKHRKDVSVVAAGIHVLDLTVECG
jgi:hypothetical protein